MGRGRDGQVQTKRMASMTTKTRRQYKEKKTGVGKINDPSRVRPKGATHLRDKSTIRRLKMYVDRPLRDKYGKVLAQKYMRYDTDTPVSRIHPDRRWFGNTKIISQKQLQLFRAEMSKSLRDPFQLVLKQKKLPYGLLNVDDKQRNRMKLLQVETYEDTFGPKMQRKKPKLKTNSLQSFAERAVTQETNYDSTLDTDKNIVYDRDDITQYVIGEDIERIFLSGQSSRIKGELYRVIDSSDVLLQVLDARDPMGTRSPHVEKYLSTNCRHKHLVLVLNKIDLVPTWCTKRWLTILSKQYPTIAFKANCMNNTKKTNVSFGKGALISLLRQFRSLFKSKRTLSVGLFGYPNVGKSSLINCLVGKKACPTAPIPGQTKVWQYVALFDRFYMIDCPGVVYPRAGDNVVSAILRSVVRIQKLENPEEYIHEVVTRVRREYLQKMYNVEGWTDAFDFMQQIAARTGKLLKGGEPDYHNVSTKILHDWQRGKLPWFVSPPFEDDLQYEYKLRNEQKRMEEELRAFTEDQQIEYEPVDVQRQAQVTEPTAEPKENNLSEMEQDERANVFKLTHEFEAQDLDERAYRQSMENGGSQQQRNAQTVDEMLLIRDAMEKMTETDKTKFHAIKVSNPLNLPNNDPLIVTAKWRHWSKKKRN